MVNSKDIYYCYPVFRPPSESNSLLIQLTEGCTYKCDFCVSNLTKSFNIRPIEAVKKDLVLANRRYRERVQKIFFLDGNAMVTPFKTLLELTKYAFQLFPSLERVGVYAHAKDIIKKSDEQLKSLSEAGLKIAYVGFESGYDKLLQSINKHATKEDLIQASKKLMKANITLSATLINGLGGAGNLEVSKAHAIESADLVNKIVPKDERIWYISFLSLMIPPGTILYDKKKQGLFKEMNSTDILKELKVFIEHINFDNKKANCVFRSNHASNFLPLKGVLEKDKMKLLKAINFGLEHTEVLRPEFYRAL
jgi:radical SAM superfamily enzyme YgiQ (UPF0313 family)